MRETLLIIREIYCLRVTTVMIRRKCRGEKSKLLKWNATVTCQLERFGTVYPTIGIFF